MERVSEWQQQSKDDEKSILKLYYFYAKYISFESIFVWLELYVMEWVGGCACICFCIGFYVNMWACECLRFYTCLFICILLPVSLPSSHFPAVTIQFYFQNIRIEIQKKLKREKATEKHIHLIINIFLSAFSLSSLLAYPTLVLLPFIHFTFIIRTKHIRFIWRVHLQHQKNK